MGPRRTYAIARALVAALLSVGFVAALSACSPQPAVSGLPDPVAPAPPDLSTPEAAVATYLDWVSFSYRMANSDIATPTMTADEWVRVDAYIEYNRQQGRGIEQELMRFETRDRSVEETRATIAASEQWRYRYFSLDSLAYTSEPLEASYETTYTLVREAAGWLVTRVEASPMGAVE